MKTKVIVLGHSGFIGKNIYLALKKKYKKNKNFLIKGFSSKLLDLTKKTSIKKLKKIINSETIIVICSVIKPKSDQSIKLFKSQVLIKNLKMIKNISFVVKKQKPKKIIYLSSNAVYGVHKNNKLIDEKTKICTDTFYGKSKHLFEKSLKQSLGLKNIKRLIILRPAIVYGPKEKFIAGNPYGFSKLLLRGKKISIWGDGTEVREFLYVQDLTKIIIHLMKAKFFGVLNVGGICLSYIALIKKISKFLKLKPEIVYMKRTSAKVNKVYSRKLFKEILPNIKFTSIEKGIYKTLS